jgi:opacity protein-like surface antigen
MRRFFSSCIALALVALPATAAAQTYVFFGGGASMPIGDSKDALKTGWIGNVGIGRGIAAEGALSLQAEGLYGSNTYKAVDAKLNIFGAFVNLEYDINQNATLHPYVYVGGGMLGVKPEEGDSDTKGAYQAGVGLGYKMTPAWTLWGDVRYMSSAGDNNLSFTPITFGFSYSGFGKK